MTKFSFILVLLFVIGLTFISGCTSPSTTVTTKSSNPASTLTTQAFVTKTQSGNASPSVVTLALFPQDLPKGFNITYDGWLEPDNNCTADKLCMLEGYSISVNALNNTTVEQNVMSYNKPATNATLEAVLNEGYPEFSNLVINELQSPGVGDVSRLWKYIPPKEIAPELQGYFIVFGKGNVYEIIHVSGTSPDLEAGKKLAAIAAAKL